MSANTPAAPGKSTPKVAREVAEAEFARMCDARRLDHDTSEMAEDEKKEWLNDVRAPIVRELMSGRLIVGDDGSPTYTPARGSSVTFYPPTGATLIALETYGKGKDISNMMAAIADMTRTDRGEFGKMDARDVQACMRIGKLFLGGG